MLQSLLSFVDNLFAEGVAHLFGPWTALTVVLIIGFAIWLPIAWYRRRQRLAKDRQQAAADQQYRMELREFVLAPVAEMNEALRKLRWDMTNSYNGPNKDSLNGLFEQQFEHAIRGPYGKLARLAKSEADLPVIEEELRRYLNNYRAEPAMLRRYMTLSGLIAEDPLWRAWLGADERCFRALRKLQALPRALRISDLPASATDTTTLAINTPWK